MYIVLSLLYIQTYHLFLWVYYLLLLIFSYSRLVSSYTARMRAQQMTLSEKLHAQLAFYIVIKTEISLVTGVLIGTCVGMLVAVSA